MKPATIAFIGGGNMATSLIGGLVQNGFDRNRIRVSDPVDASRVRLASDFGVATTDDNQAACTEADVVVLAVKPQIMKTVATALAPALKHKPVVVSIAAGIPVSALQTWLGADTPIVRCMPNTPALVHQGATGIYPSPQVSPAQRALTEQIFSAVGLAAWVDKEEDIDTVTALSGSGPAYFFLLIEAMQKSAMAMGLDRETATRLTLQTALGAAAMAKVSDVEAEELRRRVTSPGGTTAAAIEAFMAGDFPSLVNTAMSAAKTRAEEMAREFSE